MTRQTAMERIREYLKGNLLNDRVVQKLKSITDETPDSMVIDLAEYYTGKDE